MSFTGDLEHLPIVDIVQLLHQTRKSGTLCLHSHKGESQLVFKDGFIVSANHHNNSLRIGHILLDMNAVTEEEVEMALAEQKTEGADKKPLIAILIEKGQITKEAAFKGLETLIEMTIVEVLKWTEGTFTLDITSDVVSDEYRYFPEKLHEDMVLDTQSVLMDALRIFDEKNRDGTLEEEDWLNGDAFAPAEPAVPGNDAGDLISAADLGLDNLENLERKIPEVFTSLRDEDPAEVHRRLLWDELPNLQDNDHDRLVNYLLSLEKSERGAVREAGGGAGQAVILFSRDKLLKHVITAAGKRDGFFVFTTDEPENLDLIIGQTLSRSRQPVMVIDSPQPDGSAFDGEQISVMWRQAIASCPSLSIIQLYSGADQGFALQALQEGVRTVFPVEMRDAGVDGIITFLDAFRAYMRQCRGGAERQLLPTLSDFVCRMRTMSKTPDVALALLQLTAAFFERSLTFVVKGNVLIAERALGIKADRNDGPTQALRFEIPLDDASPFLDAVASGRTFYGNCENNIVNDHLFPEIGSPLTSRILLLPLKRSGRVIALIYADFGQKTPFPVQLELLDIASRHATLTLEAAHYRAKMEKTQN